MSGLPIVPCLWLDDQAEQAANFYIETFRTGCIRGVSRYPEAGDNPSGKPVGSVLTVDFEIRGRRFTALNGGPAFTINPTISFFAQTDSAAETDRLFSALADGGKTLMPLDRYPWSERYAWVQDRFGVSWQVMLGRDEPAEATIVPCLMFTGPQQGRAEEAMKAYVSVFPEGRIERIERYTAAEGPESSVKHGRFVVAGQPTVAMDSHIENGFTFNEGLSLQVICKGQDEVDRYWTALSAGGEPGVCGWLKDRFGLSWQVVPDAIGAWLTSKDTPARDRAFRAMMTMKKPDVGALQRAFEGRA
jgi:predicted 3-demethylubiquinone-9 3-methyltransferase (glyoxalase superfamily)